MNYKVTALTPLLVGNGQELSPIDYMVWKDQVNVLDQNRIFRLLARGPRLDGYLAQLRKATKLDFASWGGFAQNFSARRIPFENAESTAVWHAASSENLFIPTFAADHRGAYFPASALKGALRTGLIASRWNAGTMDRVAAALEGDRLPRRTAESAEAASGASQVRLASAADSAPVPFSTFKVYLTRVASLDTRQPAKSQLAWKVAGRGNVSPQRVADATPQFAEMATPGTTFTGTWQTNAFLQQPELSRALGWRSVPEPKTLFEAANQYASAQLASHVAYAEAAGLSQLRASLERLRAELDRTQAEPGSFLLCIGWGGGFVSKTAFLGADTPAYRKVLKAVPAISRSMREGVVFPKTRRIIFMGGLPSTLPGWVRVSISE